MKKLILKILLFVFVFSFKAHGQIYYNKLYDYDGTNLTSNHATTSIELSNGDFLIAGNKFLPTFGALHFIRINSSGDTVLTKSFSKINVGYYTSVGNSLIECFDGNYIQSGAITDSGSTDFDLLLIKLNENGDTLWTKTYGGVGDDIANIVCQTADSGFVLMGWTQSFSMGSASDFYMIKTDSNGNFQWQQTYGTTATEDCISGQITLDGGFVLSGRKSNMFHIVKTDSNGNFEWEQTYSGTKGVCFIKQLADSSYILTGAKAIAGFGDQAYMIKINKSGGIVWQKDYGGVVNDWFYSTPVILNDGSIVVSGHTMLGSSPIGMLLKTDSLGNQQWLRTYYANPSNDNYLYDVKLTSDNGFLMTGSGNITGQDAWVVKADSAGCEIANCNVGIDEFEAQSSMFKVYPNPSSDFTKVEINFNYETVIAELIIYNILGAEILKQRVSDNDLITIITKDFNNGIYLFVLKSNKGIIEKQKIIVSK